MFRTFLRVPLVSSIHGDNLHLESYSLLKSVSANLQHAQNLLKRAVLFGLLYTSCVFIRTWTHLCMCCLCSFHAYPLAQRTVLPSWTETSWLIKMRLSIWSFKGKAFLVSRSPWLLFFCVCGGLSKYQRSLPSL